MTGAWRDRPDHRAWLAREAASLVELARRSRVDDGFGWLDAGGRVREDVAPQLWITTRMTHVFALGDLLGLPGCGPLADHGVDALQRAFRDAEHGGWSSEAGVAGDKEAYPHAFVLLAAASASVAGRPGAAALLDEAVAVVEARFWSDDEGALLERWTRDWSAAEPYRGANANMHGVEAMLAAGDATGSPVWAQRALRVCERLIRDHAAGASWRVLEHFDEDWVPLPDYNADEPRHPFRPYGVTPGHGLEWSRLVLQVAAALDDPPGWLLEAARGLFDRAVTDGWIADGGGFVYTTDHAGAPAVGDRLHWPVTEAIGAAAALHAVTGEPVYEAWYRRCWDFAAAHLIDAERGGWHAELGDDLRPSERTWVGKPDVYHAFQAALLPRLPVAPSLAGALRDGHPA
jgi:sulfoquinovose isomerase